MREARDVAPKITVCADFYTEWLTQVAVDDVLESFGKRWDEIHSGWFGSLPFAKYLADTA